VSRVKAVKADAAPLRVGVVGVGVMGYNHARVLAEMPGVILVGVADPDDKQADFVERSLGCAAVADVGDLIALGVDAIFIAASRSRPSATASMSWSRSRSLPRSRRAARSSRPPAAPA
jgi:hypothetical protein